MNSRLAALVALLMMGGQARADVKLPRLIGDGMVLQRNAPLKVWGWADAGERVRVDGGSTSDQRESLLGRAGTF
jgi:hypothetical protein